MQLRMHHGTHAASQAIINPIHCPHPQAIQIYWNRRVQLLWSLESLLDYNAEILQPPCSQQVSMLSTGQEQIINWKKPALELR